MSQDNILKEYNPSNNKTKLGTLGEQYLDNYLFENDIFIEYIPYDLTPYKNARWDFVYLKKEINFEEKYIFVTEKGENIIINKFYEDEDIKVAIEVKTNCLSNFDRTYSIKKLTFDNFERYLKKDNINTLIYFVDYGLKKIYFASTSELIENKYKNGGNNEVHTWNGERFYKFKIDNFEDVGDIEDDVVIKLRELSTVSENNRSYWVPIGEKKIEPIETIKEDIIESNETIDIESINENSKIYSEQQIQKVISEIPKKEYNSTPVVTFEDIAKVHDINYDTVRKAFQRHKDQFEVGKDVWILSGSELKTYMEQFGTNCPKPSYIPQMIVFSESGYLKLTKPLTDKTSWDIFEKLMSCYFKIKQQIQKEATQDEAKYFAEAYIKAKYYLDMKDEKIEELEYNIEEKDKIIEESKPYVEGYKTCIDLSEGLEMDEFLSQHAIYDDNNNRIMGRNRGFDFFRDKGYICNKPSTRPYIQYLENRLFARKNKIINHKSIDITVITKKGIEYFIKKFAKKVVK